MAPLTPLLGTPRLVEIGERIRAQILRDYEAVGRELDEHFEKADSEAWPELMRQLQALHVAVEQRQAAWWIARRERTLAEIVREGIDGPLDRRRFY